MYEGTLFTYINDNEEEMTFEAFGLIVECPGNEDYEGEVKDALGKLVFTLYTIYNLYGSESGFPLPYINQLFLSITDSSRHCSSDVFKFMS